MNTTASTVTTDRRSGRTFVTQRRDGIDYVYELDTDGRLQLFSRRTVPGPGRPARHNTNHGRHLA